MLELELYSTTKTKWVYILKHLLSQPLHHIYSRSSQEDALIVTQVVIVNQIPPFYFLDPQGQDALKVIYQG